MSAGHMSKLGASTLRKDLYNCFVILSHEKFDWREAVSALKERLDGIECMRAKVDRADMAQGGLDALVSVVDSRIFQQALVLV